MEAYIEILERHAAIKATSCLKNVNVFFLVENEKNNVCYCEKHIQNYHQTKQSTATL